MPSCNISISWDITVQYLPTGHNFAPAPPPAPPPTPAPAATTIELPTPQFWPLGFGTHKQTTTVKHRMQSICLDGHDLGRMIVHVPLTPAPNNALLPLIMFKSSRKNNFKAATVKMNGTPAGTFILLNLPPMPMTSCAEPLAYPTAGSPMSWINSVRVGMSWASYLISALTLAANLLVDRFLYNRDQALKKEGILDEMKQMRKIEFLGGLMAIDDMAAFGLKSAVAAASSVARLAFTNEDGSFPLIAGAPFGVEITRTADGTYGVKGSATFSKGNTSVQVSAGAAEDGSVEGGVKATRKSKSGSKDKYGQDASSESSVGVSGKQDKDGKVEVAGQASRKNSEGDSQQAQVKYSDDPNTGKSSVTADASSKDAYGHERKASVAHSHDDETGATTDKVGVSGKNAAGEAQASTSGTTDAAGNTTSKESASVTPVGAQTSKVESTSTYPNSPRVSGQPASGLNRGATL
jgi:hypothetical protein